MRLWKSAYWPTPIKWQFVDTKIRLLYLPGEPASHAIPSGDIICATSWETAEDTGEYPEHLGEKCYLIQHFETWNSRKERVLDTWRLPLHKIVIARWLLEMAQSMGLDDVVHIPNAIDHVRFYLTRQPESRQPSVLSLYHHFPWKGTEDALTALTRLHQERPSVPVTFFGAEPRGPDLPPWVHYHHDPSQDQLRELYNQHMIYVSASWAEGWPSPPAEAMACGAVFVGTNSQGCLDYAQDGVNALISPPRNPDSLYRHILMVLDNPALAASLSRQGRQTLLSFTWEHSGQAFAQHLRKIAGASS